MFHVVNAIWIQKMKVECRLCRFLYMNKEYSYLYIINEDFSLFKDSPEKNWMKCSSYDDIINYFIHNKILNKTQNLN